MYDIIHLSNTYFMIELRKEYGKPLSMTCPSSSLGMDQ